ncbi:GIY-YIG nuclease family protein [Reinekea marina]|nr:GIY-YIG nuclease family protein [Reinekea marina]MDN3647357.1 GIY-YIG nuclease family protein [Reinekea marina]
MEVMAQESPWWVYFVKCADNSLYTGITTDLNRRVRQHNGELVGGARYTQARRPVELVYAEPCENRSKASAVEYQLRKLPKLKKQALIQTYIREQKE